MPFATPLFGDQIAVDATSSGYLVGIAKRPRDCMVAFAHNPPEGWRIVGYIPPRTGPPGSPRYIIEPIPAPVASRALSGQLVAVDYNLKRIKPVITVPNRESLSVGNDGRILGASTDHRSLFVADPAAGAVTTVPEKDGVVHIHPRGWYPDQNNILVSGTLAQLGYVISGVFKTDPKLDTFLLLSEQRNLFSAEISRDGKYVALITSDEPDTVVVISAADGALIRSFSSVAFMGQPVFNPLNSDLLYVLKGLHVYELTISSGLQRVLYELSMPQLVDTSGLLLARDASFALICIEKGSLSHPNLQACRLDLANRAAPPVLLQLAGGSYPVAADPNDDRFYA